MNTEFITSQEIAEIIKEFGGTIQITRHTKDEFGEDEDDAVVTTILGYFYEKNKNVNVNVSVSGETTISQTSGVIHRLMVVRDEESEKIQLQDEFTYNNDRYKIVDLGKFETSYFDMYCEVIK